ncbi:MAG: hypothetical protein WAO02_03515 [Verrucomicrobiia bacterium]
MEKKATTASEPEGVRQRLVELRRAVLQLHKALIDSERVSYEKIVGEIKSPNHFLQLLTKDPWFAWLHPLSQLIVAMDEALDGKEPLTLAGVDALVRELDRLMAPSESGEGFSRHYFEALQRDPDVVLAHAEVTKLRGPRKPAG